MKIALDAMGGDNAPGAVIEGAVLSLGEIGGSVALVGVQEELSERLRDSSGLRDNRIEIVNASEVIGMGESISKALRKGDSSLRVAARMVSEGHADALVSMGHSGAFMALCMMTMGKIEGVERPALGAVIPTLKGSSLLIGAGANVDAKPINLLQFAAMGHAFLKVATKSSDLTIGLLSNGEEAIKGNDVIRRAHKAMTRAFPNYVGYVEGKDLLLGNVDIVVCDGFVGNIVLKMGEGFVELLPKYIMSRISQGAHEPRGAQIPPEALEEFDRLMRENFDYKEHGGAPLLGVKGICVLGHGRSNARAVKNAICMAEKFARGDLIANIEEEISASTLNTGNFIN